MNRVTIVLFAFAVIASAHSSYGKGSGMTERWGVFELELNGPKDGNPFVDVELSAEFRQADRVFSPSGFYDGDGLYRVRFCPDAIGEWTWTTKSNRPPLDGKTGSFECVAPSKGNHGPVLPHKSVYLAYADGAPYFQIGTTCYAWAHQGDAMEEQTLKTLAEAPFNKMRMCIFPKDYSYNKNEPEYYPYEGKPLKDWDFTRFNPEFFHHFEKRVGQLMEMGVEADIILYHTYDRWGFEEMDAESDDRYLRYVVARLAAYRNVWWSMANEFDIMPKKKMSDWDRFFHIVRDNDPYTRMRGIHNCREWYDHNKPWVTHASIQTMDFKRGLTWRREYNKPVIYDECKYEGDVPQGWGNISARQMARNFWQGTLSGCYVGHGETYQHPEDLLWWSKGGVLRGESPKRIAWLKEFMTTAPPFDRLQPMGDDKGSFVLTIPGEYYLVNTASPRQVAVELAGDRPYKIDAIDIWNMTIDPVGSAQAGTHAFATESANMVYRFTPYAPGEKPRPVANASASVTNGSAPLEVDFSGDADFKQRWDFGDGEASDETNPTHTYRRFGRYVASMIVTDEAGGSGRATVPISVLPRAPRNLDEHKVWPGAHDGLVFVWGNDEVASRVLDADGRIVRTCKVRPKGDARIGHRYDMAIGSGSFLSEGVDDELLAACKRTNQLTIEATITPDSLFQRGPARIVTFSKDHTHRNFTLGQERDKLVLRLRTPKTGDNGLNPQTEFGKLEPGKPIHVIVSYFPGSTTCYIDGKLAHESGAVEGDFSNWEKCQLLFGDEAVGGRSWAGRLEGVSISSRHTGPEEAAHKHALYREQFMER